MSANAPERADEPIVSAPPVVPPTEPRTHRTHVSAAAVLIVGLLLTGVLVLGARSVHENNENRLLKQRVREAGTLVTASVPGVQSPLTSAAILAEGTNGDPTAFTKLMTPLIKQGRPFVSASLWPAHPDSLTPIATVGAHPVLAGQPLRAVQAWFANVARAKTFVVQNFLGASERRLGYGVVAIPNAHYVVYGESSLPKNRQARIASNSAFADLDYALYFGTTPTVDQLIASSAPGGVLSGPTESTTIDYGDSHILLVMHPTKELGGTLLARLPWILGVSGLILTLAAALLVETLSRRRTEAELLAHDNAQLYADQRSLAQTLQHALLPERLPAIANLEIASRYVVGVEGIEIGGDFYDVIALDDDNVFVVVGDVSGRGLVAATLMASLRFAIRAYALDGDAPATVLSKLSTIVEIGRDSHFATVLCARIRVSDRRATFANAGHLEPLVITATSADFVTLTPGPPVGAIPDPTYTETTVALPPDATLLLYTDGLVERRNEILDIGLDRLSTAARGTSRSVDEVLTRVLDACIPDGSSDDTALLGVRWH